jgi:Ca2+-binding RTX toxin-like protein
MKQTTKQEVQHTMKFLKNHFVVFFLVALAASGVAYLAWAIGANVNCIAGTCNSTNGNLISTPTDIDSGTPGSQSSPARTTRPRSSAQGGTYQLGGGNDVAYLVNPQTASLSAVTVQGEDGDDVIVDGCTSNNTLNGGNGNDVLIEDAAGIPSTAALATICWPAARAMTLKWRRWERHSRRRAGDGYLQQP